MQAFFNYHMTVMTSHSSDFCPPIPIFLIKKQAQRNSNPQPLDLESGVLSIRATGLFLI